MRILLLAYQTLSDPVSRRNYDAQRAEYLLDSTDMMRHGWQGARLAGEPLSGSPHAYAPSRAGRRENQRAFVFPDLSKPLFGAITLRLGDVTYQLWPDDAHILKYQGINRWVTTIVSPTSYKLLPSLPSTLGARCCAKSLILRKLWHHLSCL
jgi:hypothetical protein